jgi:hypothetical protein
MAFHGSTPHPFRTTPAIPSRGRYALVALLVTVLVGWTQIPGGIIELGRKGKKAKGSKTEVIVQSDRFQKIHDPNEPVVVILEALRQDIDNHPNWEATIVIDQSDPNRNAIEVVRESNKKDPRNMRISENDKNFRRTGTEYSKPRPKAEYQEVDAIDPNAGGHVRIDFVLDDASTPYVQVNVDANNNTAKDVNDKLKGKLKGQGFKVNCSKSGICKVMKPSRKFRKILFTHTNTGVNRSATGMEGDEGEIPTLSEWGLLALVFLLGAAGMYLLRRTRLRVRA